MSVEDRLYDTLHRAYALRMESEAGRCEDLVSHLAALDEAVKAVRRRVLRAEKKEKKA